MVLSFFLYHILCPSQTVSSFLPQNLNSHVHIFLLLLLLPPDPVGLVMFSGNHWFQATHCSLFGSTMRTQLKMITSPRLYQWPVKMKYGHEFFSNLFFPFSTVADGSDGDTSKHPCHSFKPFQTAMTSVNRSQIRAFHT